MYSTFSRPTHRKFFTVQLSPDGMTYHMNFSKNDQFSMDMKEAVPPFARGWDSEAKTWSLDPDYASEIDNLVRDHYGVVPAWPKVKPFQPKLLREKYRIIWLGQAKGDNGDPNHSACSATVDGNDYWPYIFWVYALQEWFDGTTPYRPAPIQADLYSVFGLRRYDATGLAQLYRKKAMELHPDVNPDANAHELFVLMQDAYNILKDPVKKARYDVGLKMEEEEAGPAKRLVDKQFNSQWGYKPDRRCGFVEAMAYHRFGKHMIHEILKWDDIVNQRGQVLVTSWDRNTNAIAEKWF